MFDHVVNCVFGPDCTIWANEDFSVQFQRRRGRFDLNFVYTTDKGNIEIKGCRVNKSHYDGKLLESIIDENAYDFPIKQALHDIIATYGEEGCYGLQLIQTAVKLPFFKSSAIKNSDVNLRKILILMLKPMLAHGHIKQVEVNRLNIRYVKC